MNKLYGLFQFSSNNRGAWDSQSRTYLFAKYLKPAVYTRYDGVINKNGGPIYSTGFRREAMTGFIKIIYDEN